jgi:hypothetical protein
MTASNTLIYPSCQSLLVLSWILVLPIHGTERVIENLMIDKFLALLF